MGQTSQSTIRPLKPNPFMSVSIPEIEFVAGVPIFPWARPVVILQGTDDEMGYQYAKQLSHIFGSWILQLIDVDLSSDQTKALRGYEWYIKDHAPEMIDFCRGMVRGSQDLGINVSYEEVLAQFCLGVDQNGEYLTPSSDLNGYPKDPLVSSQKSSQTFTPGSKPST